MCVLTLCAPIALTCFAAAAQGAAPAPQWLPYGAVLEVEVRQPEAVLDLLLRLKLPGISAGNEIQGLTRVLGGLGAKSGTDGMGLLRKLTAGGVTYAVYPGETSVLVADAADAATMESIRRLVQWLAGMAQSGQRAPKGVFYKEQPGGATFSLDGKQYCAIAGARLVVTNRLEALEKLFQRGTGPVLADSTAYQEAAKAAGDAPAALVFLNMALLRQAPNIKQSLEAIGSPFEIVLSGALKESLASSSWAAFGIRIDGRDVRVHAASDGKPSRTASFTVPAQPGQGVLPNLAVPREVAAGTFWRDLRAFYAARNELFPEKTSGAILFENFMEIFFTGRDLTEEVFARFHPEVRLVVARQQYDPAVGTPVEQYPAAALIFRIDHAEEFGEIFEEAWQKAIGINNFTRGQQAQPGLILDRALYAGVPFTFGYYSARNEKDRAHLPARFNVRPALARTGPYLILSTTDALARDVIDAVNHEDARVPASRPGAHTVIEISNAGEIAALLRANRNEMARQNAVKSGAKPKDAAAGVDAQAAFLERIENARLSFSAGEADLELRLK